MSRTLHEAGEQRTPADIELTSYSGKPAYLEAYLEHCSSIEKNIDRRLASNRFNISILTALAALAGVVLSVDTSIDLELQSKLLVGTSLLAVIVCVAWVFQILRFREVSRVKHEVAIEIENILGFERVKKEEAKFSNSSTVLEQTLSELILPIAAAAALLWIVFF